MTEETDRKKLLLLARTAVSAAANGLKPPTLPEDEIFKKEGGAFVTLKLNGKLKGCIGHFIGTGNIGSTIIDMAKAAAIEDHRFTPVTSDEVEDIEIQISLLSPMKLTDPDDVLPGVHGVYVKHGFRTGTLLPQVAEEEGWDRVTLLNHTCMKAGLPPDSWNRNDVEIYTYTAEVFS